MRAKAVLSRDKESDLHSLFFFFFLRVIRGNNKTLVQTHKVRDTVRTDTENGI